MNSLFPVSIDDDASAVKRLLQPDIGLAAILKKLG